MGKFHFLGKMASTGNAALDAFLSQRKKKRGHTTTSGIRKAITKSPFVPVRGNSSNIGKKGPNRVNPAWSSFADRLPSRSVTLMNKPIMLALAKAGGANSVNETGYSIIAGWLDSAVNSEIIQRISHVMGVAQSEGVKSRVFGHEKHVEVIRRDPEMFSPLDVTMSNPVQSKIRHLKDITMANAERNSAAFAKGRKKGAAYQLVPSFEKKWFQALKSYAKHIPGLSKGALKMDQYQLMSTYLKEPAVRASFMHDFGVVPSSIVMAGMSDDGVLSISIPPLSAWAEGVTAYSMYDAASVFGDLQRATAINNAIDRETSIVLGKLAKSLLSKVMTYKSNVMTKSNSQLKSFEKGMAKAYLYSRFRNNDMFISVDVFVGDVNAVDKETIQKFCNKVMNTILQMYPSLKRETEANYQQQQQRQQAGKAEDEDMEV